MPAINFPNNPINNQIFKDLNNNITYIYVEDPESPGSVGKWRAAYLGEESDIAAAIAAALGSTSIAIDDAIADSAAALLAANAAATDAANAVLIASGISAAVDDALDAANVAIGIANAAAADAATALANSNASQVPAGIIVWVTGTNPPTGYVKANGQSLSRSSFSRLWSWAQTSGLLAVSEGAKLSGGYGPGNGSTTFTVPDLRGLFVRAIDEGRGIDVSRVLSTYQASQNVAHGHGVNDPSHAHGTIDPGHSHGLYDAGHAHSLSYQVPTLTPTFNFLGANSIAGFNIYTGVVPGTSVSGTGMFVYASGTNLGIAGAFTGISIQANGGVESRPQNVSLLPCIKV